MSALLLDTNIISELRRPTRSVEFAGWWADVEAEDLYISVLTLGELEKGIARLRAKDPGRTSAIAAWGAQLRDEFSSRMIPIDENVAAVWGRITADRTRPVVDTLIAATAIAHDMTLVTRNMRDMHDLPVRLFNPFD